MYLPSSTTNNPTSPRERDNNRQGDLWNSLALPPQYYTAAATNVITVQDADILCGRGKVEYNHVGNMHFRDAVRKSLDHYINADKGYVKSQIVRTVLSHIRQRGGRFLRQEGDTWIELGERECREKVGRAIRDTARIVTSKKGNSKQAPSKSSSVLSETDVADVAPPLKKPASPNSSSELAASARESLSQTRVKSNTSPSFQHKQILMSSVSMLKPFECIGEKDAAADTGKLKKNDSWSSSGESEHSILKKHPFGMIPNMDPLDHELSNFNNQAGLYPSFGKMDTDFGSIPLLPQHQHVQSHDWYATYCQQNDHDNDPFLQHINDTLGPLEGTDVLSSINNLTTNTGHLTTNTGHLTTNTGHHGGETLPDLNTRLARAFDFSSDQARIHPLAIALRQQERHSEQNNPNEDRFDAV